MKLSELTAPFSVRSTKTPPNELAAIRLRISNRATYVWIVIYNNITLGKIVRKDSQWVHDNWGFTYEWPNELMTKDNRAFWDEKVRELTKIRYAIRDKTAEMVSMPIQVPDRCLSN